VITTLAEPAASLRAGALLLAYLTAAGVILSAPFIGQLRSAIRAAFPGQFVLIVGGAIAAAIGLALLAAVLRIRDRRPLRYGAIAGALVIAGGYATLLASGRPDVDVVERVHFVEYGLITFLFYRACRPAGDASIMVLPALAGLGVGTIEEWFQWFIPARIGEVRDVFLNGAAIASGLLFSAAIDPPDAFAARLRPGSAARIVRGAAAAILLFAAFVDTVHLGHEIEDPGLGRFRSRYDREELLAEARERTARWRTDPPLTLRRLSAEDQYLSEAVTHVQRRNDAWAEGDAFAAWRENLILERYYAPVLDTPSYVSAGGHRWPASQRADAQGRAGEGADYTSDAHPYPILTWPRGLVWVAALALVAAIRFGLAGRMRT
jgi:hypothetical protein